VRSLQEAIAIRGARVHNLQGVDCDLPRNRLIVITGPSGSGKSSLAFDTLYAEGQRRYVESLSTYARQFLQQMDKPDVESISGLPPAIAIEQRTTVAHPRSTVGTVTEIYDHLRVLFSAIGRPHCPSCDQPIHPQGAEQIAERLMAQPPGTHIAVLAPIVRGRKGSFKKQLTQLAGLGCTRARIDGRIQALATLKPLDPRRNHRIEVLLDRVHVEPGADKRLAAALEKSFSLADGVALVSIEGGDERFYSRRRACIECDASVPELSPRAFSFNSPYGACETCAGMGVRLSLDPGKIIPDENVSLLEGAIHPWARHGPRLLREALDEVAHRHNFSLEVPVADLSKAARDILLHGDGNGFAGVIPALQKKLEALQPRTTSHEDPVDHGPGKAGLFLDLQPYLTHEVCKSCRGARLRPASLGVRVADQSISDYVKLTISEALPIFRALPVGDRERPAADRLLHEITTRLAFLEELGVGYLTLDRPTTSLSGGEAHRIRLATQISARMRGILYVLDEPSIGLHQRDNEKLLRALKTIRDQGNTVVVVEHDEETIRAADYIVDLGEGAGRLGGRLMYQGQPDSMDGSLTGRYLRGELSVAVPASRRAPKGAIRILGAREHNLRDLDVEFPLGVLTAVTGVSGAGKSTLVNEILYRALAQKLYNSRTPSGRHREILGAEAVDKVIAIDQSPIGRTPRSNTATYTGLFALIREIFSLVPEARARGYKPGRFSFNVKGGRCETCQGDGLRAIEMHFLPDVYVLCESCKGLRYNRETLDIQYHGRSVADLLDMTVAEAQPLLSAHPRINRLLLTLMDVGLGYLKLGQSATTLSGGEAQRVRLARELGRRETGRTLYILDEPTTGLHFDDVRKLLHVLNRLIEAGNSVVVIEHNLDVIKAADHIIDMGPEAGDKGGKIVAQGPPEQVASHPRSHTGRYLRPLLKS
jgi:excinuclease ABC subunit A